MLGIGCSISGGRLVPLDDLTIPIKREDKIALAGLLEERARRRARVDLLAYCRYVKPTYHIEPFHRAVGEALMAVERGEIRRLMITAPPRHGKTELVSKTFPLWFLGRQALRGRGVRQIMHCGYGGTITDDAGEALRNLAKNDLHLEVFPDVTISVDTAARNRWHTARGDIYIAAGVGGPITGRGFHLGIIDDAVKGSEDADSEVMQEKTWTWYQGDFFSRRERGDAIVCIGTRWNEADLMGTLLRRMEEGGDQWHHLHFPAISDAGEALCPERVPLEELELSRQEVGPRTWQALWMGNPTPDEGLYFKADWFWEYTDDDLKVDSGRKGRDGKPVMIDRPMRYYGASDYAVSDGEGDYTCHIVVGVDPNDTIYVMDLWRGQQASDVWIDALLDLADRWPVHGWAEEKGQILSSVGPFISKRQMERGVIFPRTGFPSQADKRTRARSIQGRMAMHKVRFPKNAPWYPALRNEMLKFDAGANDDQVDAMSLIGRILAGMSKGQMPTIQSAPGILPPAIGDPIPDGYRGMTMDEMWESEERHRATRRRR